MSEAEWQNRKKRIDANLRSLNPTWKIIAYRDGLDLASLTHHAVTEFPTENGPADYALFVNSKLIGIIEAKKVGVGPQNVGERFDLTGSLSTIIIEELKVDITRIDQVIVPRLPSPEEKSLLDLQGGARVLQMDRWIYIIGRETPFYTLRFIVPTSIYSLGL